jgi:hypothetical protein
MMPDTYSGARTRFNKKSIRNTEYQKHADSKPGARSDDVLSSIGISFGALRQQQ